jgi:hypothetical protein
MAMPKISPPDQYATDGTRKGNPGSQKRREIKELITCQTTQLSALLGNCRDDPHIEKGHLGNNLPPKQPSTPLN